jgi:DNA-3-methyladenine glycosylase
LSPQPAALARTWFARDAPVVAVDLLGKLLVVQRAGELVAGRIIETEAYTSDDPASHTFRGPTPRNQVMFGAAGHLYVYLSYGMHRCANVVTGPEGDGQAVLLRAIEPVDGIDVMRRRRGREPLADGPGKLCQAFGIELGDNGVDLLGSEVIGLVDDCTPAPIVPIAGPRIGITRAIDRPWRFRMR